MRKKFVMAALASSSIAYADVDSRGSAGIETRYFSSGQELQASIFVEPEWYWEKDNAAWTVKPFVRVDSLDSERNHMDIREAFYQQVGDDWELRVGINKVFWGVTESQHLVDVINQTDYLEGFDGEDKLGQPMVQFTRINPWGVVDTLILPFFRERKFPGEDGHFNFSSRLMAAGEEQTFYARFDPAIYESSQGDQHIDAALRYSHTLGNFDFGIYYFTGTRRDPVLQVTSIDPIEKRISFTPYYMQMKQTGLDVQATVGAWLWKLEAFSRRQEGGNYAAAVGGFEFTLYGISEQGSDLGLLMELNWDERDKAASTPLQNDLFIGSRLTWNDEQSSELLAGVVHDLDNSERYIARLEVSRRLGDSYRLSAEAWIFNSDSPDDLAYSIRNEDFIQLLLEKFF